METETAKRCTKCGRELPATEFYRNGSGSYRPDCKDCRKAYGRQRYRSDPERFKAASHLQAARDPEHRKARDAAYHQAHKTERNARARAYYKSYQLTHRAEIRAQQRAWEEANPTYRALKAARRRARKLGRPLAFTPEDWEQCLAWWDRRCAYCGNPSGLFHEMILTADHFIPLAAEGCPGTIPTNILPACLSCNASKCDRDPSEWLIGKFGQAHARRRLTLIGQYFASL